LEAEANGYSGLPGNGAGRDKRHVPEKGPEPFSILRGSTYNHKRREGELRDQEMAKTMRVCPTCGHANPPQEFNCGQCDVLLVCSPTTISRSTKPSDPEPDGSGKTPQASTKALLKRVVTQAGFEYKTTKNGYRVLVPLGDKREQKVHVLFNGHDDDGQDIVSYVSICAPAPADDRRAMTLLRFNSKLTYAAFAVMSIGGEDHFVVTANQLAATADPDEIRKQLYEVAKRADAVEERLCGGKDAY